MARSLRIKPKLINSVKSALPRNGFQRQRDLAEDLQLSLATVSNFLNGRPVDYLNFYEICQRLGLDLQEIADFGEDQQTSSRLSYVLHLSDLHFGSTDNARIRYAQLAEDLRYELNCSRLDALILSGDIASRSTPEEYVAAKLFIDRLCQEFQLEPQQIVVVPGNHDVNWELAEEAYILTNREDYEGELREGCYREESASTLKVRDEEKYKQRFTYFSKFYQEIKGEDYSLEYDQQYSLQHLPEQNFLILGLNSAWQIDHYYKSRASIHPEALSNVLSQIRHRSAYENCLKIAVWHHPLNSAFEDRIKDGGFIERLAVAGFRLVLHGGIHRAESSSYRYDYGTDGRQINIIGAGVFGAPTQELIPGYPWQYNLLKIESSQIIVQTRRREDSNGAWKPDARWVQGAGLNPLPYYVIALDQDNPDSPKVYIERGKAYVASGSYEEAITCFQAALQVYTREAFLENWAEIQYNLGFAYSERIQGEKAEHLEQAIGCYQAALQVYTRESFPQEWVETQINLGNVYRERVLGDQADNLELAIISYEHALVATREIGDRSGEARTLGNLGNAFYSLGNYSRAIEYYQQSLAIMREIGDRAGEKRALDNLGYVYFFLAIYSKAIECHQQSLVISREISNRTGEASCLGNLGYAYRVLGQYQQAIEYTQQSLAIQREIGNRAGEANSLNNLGNAYYALEQYQQAIDYHHQSLMIAREIGNLTGEEHSLSNLGNAYYALEQYQQAIDYYQQSLQIAREIGARLREANSVSNLGNSYHALEQYQQAIEYHQQSLQIAQEIAYRPGEANSLSNLGNAYYALEQYQLAIDYYQQSLQIAREIDARSGVANALSNLGNTYSSLGETQLAIEYYQQALAITEVLGDTGHREKVLSEITQIFTQIGEFDRALATAQLIQDEQKRLEELTRVVEVVSRLEGGRVREILASLRTDSDQRICALVSRYFSTGTREALVVGINQYPFLKDQANLLKTPARDAEEIAQLLEQYGNFRVTRLPASIINGRVQIDPNKIVRLSELEAAIAELFVPGRENIPATALLFFTGHGLKKSLGRFIEGFLATSDTNPSKSLYGVSLQWLNHLLKESPVKQRVIWLDCCHSGEQLKLDEFYYELNPGQDFCFMATSKDAIYEGTANDAYRTLTSALLQGLNPETRTDGVVSSVDLVDFVRQLLKDSPYLPVSSLVGKPITLTSRKAESKELQLNTTYNLFLNLSPETVLVGEDLEVVVTLGTLPNSNNSYLLEIPYNELVGSEINILLTAPGFRLESDNAASLPLDLKGNSQPLTLQNIQTARFHLTALRPGTATITAEFYRGDTFEANLEAKVQVTGFDEASFLRQRITTQPRPIPQPEFILQVQTAWNETSLAFRFQYQLRSFRLPLLFPGETTYHSELLSSNWIEQMRGLLRTTLENISDALPEDGRSHLTSLGQYLFQHLLPPELQSDFRSLIPRDRTFTLLILADQDASLPWELLHDGQRFLSDRFIIGRWFWELNDTRPHEFPVGAINVAHYADVEQPQLWTALLEPPGASPPLPLPDGVLSNLDSTEAMRGLHLIRYSQPSDATNRRNAPVTLDDTNNAQDIERQMRPAKLNLRRNRPLVSLGYVRRDRPELTTLEQTWASAFIRAGCSAFTGSLWAVDPAVEAAFISGFYNRLWTGDSLGEAFHASRQLARAVAPDSLDWLAYVLFGDPMARPYRPVEGKGYAVVEPIGREIDAPLPPGVPVRFRLSLRRTPPVWHEERVIEVAENLTFENLQAHVKTFGLQVTPDSPIAMSKAPTGNYLGWFTLVAPPEMAGNSALVQVFLMDGMLPLHSLMFSLNIENEGS